VLLFNQKLLQMCYLKKMRILRKMRMEMSEMRMYFSQISVENADHIVSFLFAV
jgi:hypothetical protein